MSFPRASLPAALLVGTAVAATTLALPAGSTVRTLAVVAFLLLCPGLALVRLVRLPDPWTELSLGIGVSIALDLAVAGGLSYAGAWSPTASFVVLVAVTSLAAGTALVRTLRENSRGHPG